LTDLHTLLPELSGLRFESIRDRKEKYTERQYATEKEAGNIAMRRNSKLRKRRHLSIRKPKWRQRLHVYWSKKLQKMLILNQRLPEEAYGH
jgi:hypothetical protein